MYSFIHFYLFNISFSLLLWLHKKYCCCPHFGSINISRNGSRTFFRRHFIETTPICCFYRHSRDVQKKSCVILLWCDWPQFIWIVYSSINKLSWSLLFFPFRLSCLSFYFSTYNFNLIDHHKSIIVKFQLLFILFYFYFLIFSYFSDFKILNTRQLDSCSVLPTSLKWRLVSYFERRFVKC